MKHIAPLIALAWLLASGAADAQQTKIQVQNLPVPTTGSSNLQNGDLVPANRGGVTYGLYFAVGGTCAAGTWASGISINGVPVCTTVTGSSISGLGTAAFANIGTSGPVIGELTTVNNYSANQNFLGSVGVGGTASNLSTLNVVGLGTGAPIGTTTGAYALCIDGSNNVYKKSSCP